MIYIDAWLSRFRWAIKYGASSWLKAFVCASRGYHAWNTISDQGPVAPTVCLKCRANYTEEWDELKRSREKLARAL